MDKILARALFDAALECAGRWRHNRYHNPPSSMRAPITFSPAPLPVPTSPVIRTDVPLSAIDASTWDALARGHPFLSHTFLSALHETGCASRETGFQPREITAQHPPALQSRADLVSPLLPQTAQ